ncbi:MAG TPA: hypothetical protein VFC76_05590 [Oscillospiraceae bacterium]|nr:hypothetical protein [Clostridiales bacterium]HZK21733.1 hypothetical protein [Oscillospiraceae bacterium]
MRKRFWVIVTAVVAVIIVLGTSLYFYYRPYVAFISMKPSDPIGSSYTELVSVADTYKSERFLPKSFTKNLNEFGKKNQEVFLEYTEQYKKPMNVHAKIEIKNGQTVVTYYGTVTAKDGQTEEYNKQLVFDFILTKKIPEMFKG